MNTLAHHFSHGNTNHYKDTDREILSFQEVAEWYS